MPNGSFENKLTEIWKTVKSWVDHSALSPSSVKRTARIDCLLTEIFDKMLEKVRNGKLEPRIAINLLQPASDVSQYHGKTYREKFEFIHLGVLGTVGNPLTWGHLLPLFASFNFIDLDTATILIHGAIRHKLASDAYSEEHRLNMARMLLQPLEPLIRFSNLGSGEDSGKQSEEVIHQIFAVNPNRKIAIHFLTGFEGLDILTAKLGNFYKYACEYKLHAHPVRNLSIHLVGRLSGNGMLSENELNNLSKGLAWCYGMSKPIPVFLHRETDLDLGTSSTYYRSNCDPSLVPLPVHMYIMNIKTSKTRGRDVGDPAETS